MPMTVRRPRAPTGPRTETPEQRVANALRKLADMLEREHDRGQRPSQITVIDFCRFAEAVADELCPPGKARP